MACCLSVAAVGGARGCTALGPEAAPDPLKHQVVLQEGLVVVVPSFKVLRFDILADCLRNSGDIPVNSDEIMVKK